MRFFILSLSLLVCSLSCKKDSPLKEAKDLILGKWEIESSFCGICLIPSTNYPIGNGEILIFYKDGKYERLANNVIAYVGKYELKKSSICNGPTADIELTMSENAGISAGFVKFNAGKLIFSTPYCYADGGSSTYRRIP